jgi:hypothetical protein
MTGCEGNSLYSECLFALFLLPREGIYQKLIARQGSMSKVRASEAEYFEGVVKDLFSKWDRLGEVGSEGISVSVYQSSSNPAAAGGADAVSYRVALLRRLTKGLAKFEQEIPFIRGSNWVDEQFKHYVRLFNYEAKLRYALATGRSLKIPLDYSVLQHTIEANLFMEAFTTAVLEWVQVLGGLRRRSDLQSEAAVHRAVAESPVLKSNLQVKITIALNAADGRFKHDTLDEDTMVLLTSYALKLRQLAILYGLEVPHSASELAREEAQKEGKLPLLSPAPIITETAEESLRRIDAEERRNIEAIARRMIERSRDKELQSAGAVSVPHVRLDTVDKVPWTAFDPTGCPAELVRTKLIQFYTLYNPEKVEDVDAILEHYAGREAELFRALEAKYLGMGEAPSEGTPESSNVQVPPPSAAAAQPASILTKEAEPAPANATSNPSTAAIVVIDAPQGAHSDANPSDAATKAEGGKYCTIS